jgi:hypothetical protein
VSLFLSSTPFPALLTSSRKYYDLLEVSPNTS